MIPVSYYPPAMQKRFGAAREALAGSPYEPFLNERLTVPEAAALGIQRGSMEPIQAMSPNAAALNAILDAGTEAQDWGYTVLEGPTLYVQSRIDFPGSTPDMFKWWFWWHALDPRRYMLWFPYSHISATAADPGRLADEALSFEERFYDNRQHVAELMGADHFESVIRFVDPSHLGFNMAKFRAAGFEASASGLLEMPGLPDITVGMMVHIVRPTKGGMELFNRYWLGSHPDLWRFPGADQAGGLFAGVGMDEVRMESVAYELAVHDMTEWNNLARILPALHAEFGE